ncbi:hypothetical protein Mp_1g29280 [Marchantia polymorpha subsp. ruderalis]|uniref:Uncharacterized protein n=2 Tax=Marchantia polymorpha TaxID=3197 RepID=A0AAF6AVH7_MARPO|nr:hypothetical protein MARPO_0107s0043 [Marchantia polymorpha]BBN00448.1 hypothetical protein Mp_1g29280 [Marchantia polymorpha subsp. ruderalis]|eukprot:PTQ31776.1 hypothetical protein MARPO_0107s0043 [Marchantia polymorpha]
MGGRSGASGGRGGPEVTSSGAAGVGGSKRSLKYATDGKSVVARFGASCGEGLNVGGPARGRGRGGRVQRTPGVKAGGGGRGAEGGRGLGLGGAWGVGTGGWVGQLTPKAEFDARADVRNRDWELGWCGIHVRRACVRAGCVEI